jgi:Holliday junction resolvasome RuvABC DNA-binding subunit
LAYNDLEDIMISFRRLGYTNEEIEDAVKVIKTIRAQRKQSAKVRLYKKPVKCL